MYENDCLQVDFGERFYDGNGDIDNVLEITFREDGVEINGENDCPVFLEYGEKPKRPPEMAFDRVGKMIELGDRMRIVPCFWDKCGTSSPSPKDIQWSLHGIRPDTTLTVEGIVDGKVMFEELASFCPSDWIVHEERDSWEKIEDDSTMTPGAYCHDYGLDCQYDYDPWAEVYVSKMVEDIVRRSKRLAEVGE